MDIIVLILQAIAITILACILMMAITIGAFVLLITVEEGIKSLRKKGGKKK